MGAIDNGTPPLGNVTVARVLVQRNTARPQFVNVSISVTIFEDDPSGVEIARVSATDGDLEVCKTKSQFRHYAETVYSYFMCVFGTVKTGKTF